MTQDPKPRVLERRLGELDVYLLNSGTMDTIAYHDMERKWLFHNFQLGKGRCLKLTHNKFAYRQQGGFSIHLLNEVVPRGSAENPFGVIPASLILDQFFPGQVQTISPSTERCIVYSEKLQLFEKGKKIMNLPYEKGDVTFLSDDVFVVRYHSDHFWKISKESTPVMMLQMSIPEIFQLDERYAIFHVKDTGISIIELKGLRTVVLENSKYLDGLEIFWADRTHFLVYGKRERMWDRYLPIEGIRDEEKSWLLDINDITQHFFSGLPLKIQLIRDNFSSSPSGTMDDLNKVGNAFPFVNQVGRVHRFETLDRYKPELRKEAHNFLIENVLWVPVAVLGVVAKFIA